MNLILAILLRTVWLEEKDLQQLNTEKAEWSTRTNRNPKILLGENYPLELMWALSLISQCRCGQLTRASVQDEHSTPYSFPAQYRPVYPYVLYNKLPYIYLPYLDMKMQSVQTHAGDRDMSLFFHLVTRRISTAEPEYVVSSRLV